MPRTGPASGPEDSQPVMGIEEFLDDFGRQDIKHGDRDEPDHDRRGQRDKAEDGVERQVRQGEGQGGDDDRRDQQPASGTAPIGRAGGCARPGPPGALSAGGFDEPAGTEDVLRPFEDEEERAEGQEIEHGADQAEDDHEVADGLDIPAVGVTTHSGSTLSPAMAMRRDVGQEVVEQDLLGQERQERQEERRRAMLNMLPKLALVVVKMYLSVLAKVMRPSSTPRQRTSRPGLRRTKSAASRATSTALRRRSRCRRHGGPGRR